VPEEKKSKLKKISRELKISPQNEICTYGYGHYWIKRTRAMKQSSIYERR
jgi:hypothetical protein